MNRLRFKARAAVSNSRNADLLMQIKAVGLPVPDREFRFHPVRRWRADFAWPDQKILVEVDGGVYVQGRHTRGRGFEEDMRKLNAAAVLGYRVLRFSTGMVKNGEALATLEDVLGT